jgi:hypothetical protein
MLPDAVSYPYAVFRGDLRNLGGILKAERILHHDGEWLEIGDDRHMVQNIRRIWSYFNQRYPKEDERMEIGSAYMQALAMIERNVAIYAPGHDLGDLTDSGFDLASEPLLQATHSLCTEVDTSELGERAENLDFLLEVARSRFGYNA